MAKNRRSKPAASSTKSSAAAASTHATPPISEMPSAFPRREPSSSPEVDQEDEPGPNVQPFRFFDLPSELRLRIYEEVFHVTERHVMELYEGKRRAGNIKGLDERPDPPLDLGKLQPCCGDVFSG